MALLLFIGVLTRVHNITRFGVWRDEYWALYLATGRGDALFDLPSNTILHSPPDVGFSGAPGWWHIWAGLHSVTHPPGYYFLLRWWVDLFGQTDLAIRMLSTLFGVASIAMIFNTITILRGKWYGLIGAVIMMSAPIQIDFAQQARPYTLIAFEGLMICNIVLRIQRYGSSALRLCLLGIAVTALILTHYFAVGIVAAAFVYAAFVLRDGIRFKTLSVIAFCAVLTALAWAPMLWKNRDAFQNGLALNQIDPTPVWSTIDVPQRLLLGRVAEMKWPAAIALAFLVYVLALVDLRKRLWWLWIVFTLSLILTVDLYRHSALLAMDRYIFLASPAVYIVLALPIPCRLGSLVPITALIGSIAFGAARFQQGPDFSVGSMYQIEDARPGAVYLKDHLQPGDLVILATNNYESSFEYFVLSHYNGPWHDPVVRLTAPPAEALKQQIFSYRRVWMVGGDAPSDTEHFFSGASIRDLHGTPFGCVWRIK